MKKSINLIAAVAVVSMALVACNNNKPAEETVDTTAIEQTIEENIDEVADAIDTATTAVAEETKAVAKKAATTTKKAAEKATEQTMTVATEKTAEATETPVVKRGEQKAPRGKRQTL